MEAPRTAPAPSKGHPAPRPIAVAVWAAMLAMQLAFLAMVLAVERPTDDPNASRELLFWTAVASSALGIVLSRAVPQRLRPGHAAGNSGTSAFVRFLVGWGLTVVVAIYPLVAHMLIHDHRLLVVFAVDLLALVTLYPSRNAWAQLAAVRAEEHLGRMVH